MTDPRITAIRNHPKVGNGSCTSIDECYTDDELVSDLDSEEIGTVEGAIQWALEVEGYKND